MLTSFPPINKKVLLREHKRHTARRVAIAISCYSGGGGPLTKKFFPVLTCIKPNLVSKNFPFTGVGGPLTKNFFSSLNMYQAKSGVKKFSPLLRLGTPLPPIQGWISLSENLRPKTPPPPHPRLDQPI